MGHILVFCQKPTQFPEGFMKVNSTLIRDANPNGSLNAILIWSRFKFRTHQNLCSQAQIVIFILLDFQCDLL